LIDKGKSKTRREIRSVAELNFSQFSLCKTEQTAQLQSQETTILCDEATLSLGQGPNAHNTTHDVLRRRSEQASS
jgi:hypothetical protein